MTKTKFDLDKEKVKIVGSEREIAYRFMPYLLDLICSRGQLVYLHGDIPNSPRRGYLARHYDPQFAANRTYRFKEKDTGKTICYIAPEDVISVSTTIMQTETVYDESEDQIIIHLMSFKGD